MKDYDLDQSIKYNKKKSGPKIDPWDTPASIGDHENAWSFK